MSRPNPDPGAGVARFVPGDAAARDWALRLANPALAGSDAVPASVPAPRFALAAPRGAAVDGCGAGAVWGVQLPAVGVSVYGLGEQPGPLRRRPGREWHLWNTDDPTYGPDTPHSYQALPYVLCVRPDGSAYAAIFDTTYRLHVAVTETAVDAQVMAHEDGQPVPLAVSVLWGPSPLAVTRALTVLTGLPPLPPLWALGYHQCRWSYYPAAALRAVALEFRTRRLPVDAIWYDIHYMDGYRIFTVDRERFPDIRALTDELREQDIRSVFMIDPGVKVEPGFALYDEAVARGLVVRASDGSAAEGAVWPGPCVFPDFTLPAACDWWAALYPAFAPEGWDGIWNDMNEVAVFNELKTLPADSQHAAGSHARFHNVYGQQMVAASRRGMLAAHPNRRPFLLTRANALGGQRYAATWTGDNQSTWPHLRLAQGMLLNLALSAQSFAGADIGGFGGDATPELWARWIGVGALYPFARGHTHLETAPHEPWVFGAAAEATTRTALERRYMLLPYLYTLFARAASAGDPVMQPAFFSDPADAALRDEECAFLLGDALLVVADVECERTPLPAWVCAPRWAPLPLDTAADPDLPALFLRAGCILPSLQAPVQSSAAVAGAPWRLTLHLDSAGCAEGTLYVDRGDGFEHEAGDCVTLFFTARRVGSSLTLDTKAQGAYAWPAAPLRVHVLPATVLDVPCLREHLVFELPSV